MWLEYKAIRPLGNLSIRIKQVNLWNLWTMARKKFRSSNAAALLYVFLHALIGDTEAAVAQGTCVMPPTFGSFNGHPASTLNDCIWDFNQCTHKTSLSCCQKRFDMCCEMMTTTTTPPPRTTTPSTTTPPMETTTPCRDTDRCQGPPPKTLPMCVWKFNDCIQNKYNCKFSEDPCYKCFDECCKSLGMTGMKPMLDNNFVNELPAPFMSVESTTTTTTTTTTTPKPVMSRTGRKPSLAQCLWSFFRCSGTNCNKNWNNCMSGASGFMNPWNWINAKTYQLMKLIFYVQLEPLSLSSIYLSFLFIY